MKNRWSNEVAEAYKERYAEQGNDVALRVYTSQLIGTEPDLVLHGGGNTSVKSVVRTILGEDVQALFVKGSGWSLDTIEPGGFPAVDLLYLQRLRALESLSDEEMVNQLRTHLFDASAPTPSVEALLHAFIPHKFVDHSHADAILTLTNQPKGMELIREALGEDIPIVPYVMPGFDLSKAAAKVVDAHPDCEGIVLHKHGLFTFGATAQESYERHIRLVSLAEEFIDARTQGTIAFGPPSKEVAAEQTPPVVSEVAPILRGVLSEFDPQGRHWVLLYRINDLVWNAAWSANVEELLLSGPMTPDHSIRTKNLPMVVGPLPSKRLEDWRGIFAEAVKDYAQKYQAYFDEQVAAKGVEVTRLDPLPRVIVVRNFGIFTVGQTTKDASIVADIYDHTLKVKSVAPLIGAYEALPPGDLFDVEYWSLEQAKLGKKKPKPLQGKVALVTGAAGAIGAGVVQALCAEGANVIATDIRKDDLDLLVRRINDEHGKHVCFGVPMDQTNPNTVEKAIRRGCAAFGGIDIAVLNAGIAMSAPLDEIALSDWQRVVNVNLTGYFIVMQAVVAIMKRQRTGGSIIINSSKNVFAPGAEFGAYSASKAGGHQLGKVAALELAAHNIRVNMINADAVFGDQDTPSQLWAQVGPDRAKAKGIGFEDLQEHYRQRNLLKTPITPEDVARAVLFFARQETPTTGATLPVDGGIAGAFPR